MSNPSIDIWPILQRLGITITEAADGWVFDVRLGTNKGFSGSGYATADEAIEEAIRTILGQFQR